MQYLSTRGGISPIPFSQAVMMGLASDGGLLLPRNIPRIGAETFSSWSELSYAELAFEIMSRFIDDIPSSNLRDLINRSYASFSSEEVTPLVHHGELHILELFHGPTLAFKDVALQFLGNLFEYLLERDDGYLNIVGATSGDTGSAAIYGVRGKKRIKIFILHPRNRISPVQERQMTTVTDDNVYNIAIEGTFDDGQAVVKALFNDLEFKKTHHLGAINSINWARILAQVVYYVYSCLHVIRHENDKAMDFSIPTGNFGDIFAGYIAKNLLPEGTVRKLVLASNANDILSRFVNMGDYSAAQVQQTSSPSMDIQAASNFERYLYYLLDKDPERTTEAMLEFAEKGRLDLSGYCDQIKRDFSATSVSEEDVEETIRKFHTDYGYLLDPHTAVGVYAGLRHKQNNIPMICLATAHPAKFAETVRKAAGIDPEQPEAIQGLFGKQTRCEIMDADRDSVQEYIRTNALLQTDAE
ncbi:threonine synthase [Desulfopila inferna]|uniref:threonine synthase n=1 Tax=Desulfopila inferna TaxID=468528 RepID=UPI001965934E|nr:threonine synthase [Desulfopila inferna]MBM9604583.1 threonine synthase [Desulfopila inferna]